VRRRVVLEPAMDRNCLFTHDAHNRTRLQTLRRRGLLHSGTRR
jgi:hypothetical protein